MREGAPHRKHLPGSGDSQCHGPEVKHSKEAHVAGEGEGREEMGAEQEGVGFFSARGGSRGGFCAEEGHGLATTSGEGTVEVRMSAGKTERGS